MSPKLDAHMHVWTLARGDYGWLTEDYRVLYRDFAVGDAWPEAGDSGTSEVILVQAAGTAAETDFMLSIAETDARVAGVVGWVDFEAPDAVAEVARRGGDPRIVGLRPMIADLPDPDWILRPDFVPVFAAMERHGLVFDGHARPDLVTVMDALARRHPGLQIVLNHGGKPPIASGDLGQWRDDLSRLAECPNVACKLSGLLTEAGPHTDDGTIGAAVAHMGICFGSRRLLWGSDWPVLKMAGTYTQWAEQSERLVARLFPADADDIWRGNAARIYLENKGWEHGTP